MTIRYDVNRLMCTQKLAGASLVYGMEPKTKTDKGTRGPSSG